LEAQEAFFTATFSVMGHLAKADGRVSENEIRVAQNIMDRLDLNNKLRKEAMRLFSEGKEPHFNLTATLSKLYQECHRHPDLLRFFIEIQLEAGLADGQLHPEERRILLLICEQLHFSPQDFEQLWARQWAGQAFHEWFSSQFDPNARSGQQRYSYQQNTGGQRQSYSGSRSSSGSLQDAYGVLGIVPSATQAEIKKAYRRLMNQHHPDKLAARGLPENMMKLAKEKTQQIRAAYDLVREARGFR
jgi:DnaJ like chaperone protein